MCGSGSKFGIRIRIHKVVEYGSLSRGSGTALPLQEEEAEADDEQDQFPTSRRTTSNNISLAKNDENPLKKSFSSNIFKLPY